MIFDSLLSNFNSTVPKHKLYVEKIIEDKNLSFQIHYCLTDVGLFSYTKRSSFAPLLNRLKSRTTIRSSIIKQYNETYQIGTGSLNT